MRAWTVGNPKHYDPALRGDGPIAKATGGWVWRTLEEALDWLDAHHWGYVWDSTKNPIDLHPYELSMPGTWESCVNPNGDPVAGVDTLKRRARIVGKWEGTHSAR